MKIVKSVKDRFWKKVEIKSKDECWEWSGTLTEKGYGRFSFNLRNRCAHRFSWILQNGDIGKDKMILHKCDNPKCVNPHHLFEGTARDNMMDCINKGRHANQKKTHCVNGHKYSMETTGYRLNGDRFCKTCKRFVWVQ